MGVCTCAYVYLHMITCMCVHMCINVCGACYLCAHVSLCVWLHVCVRMCAFHVLYISDSMCGRVQLCWASWYNYTFNVIFSTFLPALVLDLSAPFFPLPIRQLNQLSLQQHLPVGVLQNLNLLPKLQILRWTRLHPEQGIEKSKCICSVEPCWARSSGGDNWGAEKEDRVPTTPGKWGKEHGQPELGRRWEDWRKKKNSLVISASMIKNEQDGTKCELLLGVATLFSLTSSLPLSPPITLLSLDYGVWVLSAVLLARRTHRKPTGLGRGKRGGEEPRTSEKESGHWSMRAPKRQKKVVFIETSYPWMITELMGQNGTT